MDSKFRYRIQKIKPFYNTRYGCWILGYHSGVYEEYYFFLDVTPCTSVEGRRRFKGNQSFHLQGQRVGQRNKHQEAGGKQIKCYVRKIHLKCFSRRECIPLYLCVSVKYLGTYILRLLWERGYIIVR
jgi:hypothetical protein